MKKQHVILILLLFAVIIQCSYYYVKLPDTLASHFGKGGNPDSWSSKTEYFAVILVAYGFGIGSVVFGFFILPSCIKYFPDSMISLPNKDYWLAPERREKTFRDLRPMIDWMGIMTIAFIVGVMQIVFRSSLPDVQHFSIEIFLVLVGLYAAYSIVWGIRLYRRFSKPPTLP